MSRGSSRRSFLHVGFCGGIGLTLSQYFKLQSAQADIKNYETKEGTAKSVIFIFLPGGMAHQESFDPKPYAPIEYRGPMNSIESNVPGIFINERWVQTAQVMDKIAICRSMTHGEAAHERGTHNMFTGYRPSPALSYPSMGSVVSHEFEPRNNIPPYICIPGQPNEFAGTGYLSSSFAPFSLGSDPADGGFTVRDLQLPGGVTDERFTRRRRALDTFYQRAYGLISSKQAQEAFDLSKEADALRDAYGRNQAGARMLMARRLVEAGARFVTLTYGGWDMHDNIAAGMNGQVPPFDQAFCQLIRDLDSRGRLQDTMVVIASEFGRTPKINGTAGRDHWPKVFSVVMAGGGIKGGQVYGTSNSTASEPDEKPLNVEDWATTIYHCLGITADKELMAPGDRPIEIVDGGKVRSELLV
jgi:hypothetical protein